MLKLVAGLAAVALPLTALADEKYREPPPAIRAVLRAPWVPVTHVSPNGKFVVSALPNLYPPISELAAPMFRLAGVRVNPRANDIHVPGHHNGVFTLRQLPDGKDVPIKMPKDLRPGAVAWNADGSRFAFVDHGERAVELWIVDATAAEAKKVANLALDPILGSSLQWMPDGKSLVVKAVPDGRGAPPPDAPPTGPDVQDSTGVTKPSSTYEARDLLRTPHDADLFEYYATSQLAIVDATTLAVKRIGKPAVLGGIDVAPDGAHLLVMRILRPYVYTRPWRRFAREIELWDRDGKKLETIAKLPVADQVPIDGVETGPREVQFVPTAPATLFWVEALDQGDWAVKAKHRDRLVRKQIGKPATTWFELEQRFEAVEWLANGEQALVTDFERDRRWTRTFLVPDGGNPTKLVWDRSINDAYGDPGSPVHVELASGVSAVRVDNGAIYLTGAGATPQGYRPFLDRLELATLKTERLFRADTASLESFVAWLDPSKGTFFTQKQSPTLPPNLALRTLGAAAAKPAAGEAARASELRMVTKFADPTPSVRGITKRLVTTKRADGTQLSFTLYLPPNYRSGTRLPTVFWAYPLEYSDPTTAGQVNAAPNEFTAPIGAAYELFALQGYAVLDVAMPVVGPPETVYDTFVEQIVSNATAAIDKAVELGVTDRDRVGVMGHSHGALMTANLLAYSDLFRAGIARSGAYNHTLRPFGFQTEHRTLYQARDTYLKLSPLLNADKINEPLLLIHGALDANPGTVPLQSEKLFEALRGVHATARLVMLPFESHGYAARESVEDVMAEMIAWFDRYVKNAPPRNRR